MIIAGGFVSFFLGRRLRRITSFQELINDLAEGKESNIFMKIMFWKANGRAKGVYNLQMKLFGDKGTSLMLNAAGYFFSFISIASIVGLMVFLLTQI